MTHELQETLNSAVKVVNAIKARSLISLFTTTCEEMGSAHTHLLLHTTVNGRSKVFCKKNNCDLANNSVNDRLYSLGYLGDIFNKKND